MMDESASFNLVDEPWIKARTLSGGMVKLSLLEVFRQAAMLKCLANDVPTQDFAILRVLLAILQRSIIGHLDAYDYPSDAWGALWEADELPLEEIGSYLEEWRYRFDILDDEQPFMQVAGLCATNGSISEIKKLIVDVPDGKPLFSLISGSALGSIGFDEAARWLIHVHAFDTSGIKTGVKDDTAVKGGKSYPIGTGWAGGLGGIYLEGPNLAKTLLLNLILCDDCYDNRDEWVTEDDLPVWEQPQKTPGNSGRAPIGYADVYTWQSRRVRLVAKEDRAVGVVLTNGDKLDSYNRNQVESMTSWRRSTNQEKKLRISPVYLPYSHQSERAIWRGLTSILPQKGIDENESFKAPGVLVWTGFLSSENGGRYLPYEYPIRIHAVGLVYGTQSAVVTELVDDSMMVNAFLLSDEGKGAALAATRSMVRTGDAVVMALGRFATRLRLAAGDDSDRAAGAREAAKAEAYFELDAPFRAWLASLNPSTDLIEAELHWNALASSIIRSIARRLVEEAGPDAIVGRKVKMGNAETWVSAGSEERRFHYQLSKALPLESDSGQEEQESENGD